MADAAPDEEATSPDDDPAPAEVAGADAVVTEPEQLHGAPVSWSKGQRVAHPDRDGWVDVVRALHEDGYHVCVDLTAVDYLTYDAPRHLPDGVAPERFEVVAGLLRHRPFDRVRLRVQVPEHDPVLPTLFELHPGTEALEREVFDMFGIAFEGHPDLTRILMPEDWVGHPLRKDADNGRIPVQFKADPSPR